MKLTVAFLAAALLFASCTSIPNVQNYGNISDLKSGTTATNCNWGRVEIAPGEEHLLAQIDGAGMIDYFYITDGRGGIQSPNLVLRIYWDGSEKPSVNVPLADFFGSLRNINVDYESQFMTVRHNCHQCYFPMPFSNGAKVVLYNDGPEPYIHDVAYNVEVLKDNSFVNNKSRFHAFYNRSNPTNGTHTILNVTGRGHYVGNFLHVYTGSRRWWGEGDTDFILDGTEMKHTPGTEDEYGACFDFGGKFSYMTCGYIMGGKLIDEANQEYSYTGHNRMYRWYSSNPVRFTKSLKVTVQNQYCAPNTPYDFKGQQGANDDYSSVAYFYLEGAQPSELMPLSSRTEDTKAVIY